MKRLITIILNTINFFKSYFFHPVKDFVVGFGSAKNAYKVKRREVGERHFGGSGREFEEILRDETLTFNVKLNAMGNARQRVRWSLANGYENYAKLDRFAKNQLIRKVAHLSNAAASKEGLSEFLVKTRK